MPKNEAERQKSRTKQARHSSTNSTLSSSSLSPSSSPSHLPENVSKVLLECAQRGHIEQFAKILECSQVSCLILDEAFLLAAEHGHLRIVAFLADKVSTPFCCNARGESGLCLTARNGYVEVAIALLKLGLPIDARSNDGITPLYAAVEYNQEEMGFFLLDQKADVNATDVSKNSILHVAASNGFAEVVLMVLKAGASTNAQNAKDETPLEVAKNADICRVILEFHAGYHALQEKPALISTDGEGSLLAISPFRELPPGPASYLFWTAMGVGKDSYMFQNFGVYPFDRLNDTERIIALTEVAEAMSGYKMDLKCNILNESALYAVFALMKARIKKELDDCEKVDDVDNSFLWRKRVLEAYEQVYNTNGALSGLSFGCWKRSVWNTVVNLLARSLFGESFWEKKRMFLSLNALERLFLLKQYRVGPNYFVCKLPSTASIEIQLTFKKLITMSKTFLCDEPVRPSGCFCQDCIAEFEVPLTFKLQFLEEAAEEKRKVKKSRKVKAQGKIEHAKQEEANRSKLDELVLVHRKELKLFWSAISIEEKWCLTEMSTTELSDIIATSTHWETLRAALESYAKYAWEEDLLELTEECVTIADDMCEEKGMLDMLEAMLNAVENKASYRPPATQTMTEDEWDKIGRQMLEKLVLAEFARKIAAQYILKKQESRAQQVALELELELLQEEEQQIKDAEKRARANKKKRNRNKKKNQPQKKTDGEEGDENDDDEANGPESMSEGEKKHDAISLNNSSTTTNTSSTISIPLALSTTTTTNGTTTTTTSLAPSSSLQLATKEGSNSSNNSGCSPKKTQRKLKQDPREKELLAAAKTAVQIVAAAREMGKKSGVRCTHTNNNNNNNNSGSSSGVSANGECVKESVKEAKATVQHVINKAVKEATRKEKINKSTTSHSSSSSCSSSTSATHNKGAKKDRREGTTNETVKEILSETVNKVVEAAKKSSPITSSSVNQNANRTGQERKGAEKKEEPKTDGGNTTASNSTTPNGTDTEKEESEKEKEEENDEEEEEEDEEEDEEVQHTLKQMNRHSYRTGPSTNNPFAMLESEEEHSSEEESGSRRKGVSNGSRVPKQRNKRVFKNGEDNKTSNVNNTHTATNNNNNNNNNNAHNNSIHNNNNSNSNNYNKKKEEIRTTTNTNTTTNGAMHQHSAARSPFKSASAASRILSNPFSDHNNHHLHPHALPAALHPYLNSFPGSPLIPMILPRHNALAAQFIRNPGHAQALVAQAQAAAQAHAEGHKLPVPAFSYSSMTLQTIPLLSHAKLLPGQSRPPLSSLAKTLSLNSSSPLLTAKPPSNSPLITPTPSVSNSSSSPSAVASSAPSASPSSISVPLLRTPVFPTLSTSPSNSDPPLASSSSLRAPLAVASSRSTPCSSCSNSSSSSPCCSSSSSSSSCPNSTSSSSSPSASSSSSCSTSTSPSPALSALPSSILSSNSVPPSVPVTSSSLITNTSSSLTTNTAATRTTTSSSTPTTSPSTSLLVTPPPGTLAPLSVPSRQSPGEGVEWEKYKDGMMFICSQDTYRECVELCLLGLPRRHSRLVRSLRPQQSALFLFNVSDRHLRGVFEASGQGQENIHEHAWTRSKHRPTPYPSQIEYKIVYQYDPIPESCFRHLFSDGNRVRKLDAKQVQELINLFRTRTKAGMWSQRDKLKTRSTTGLKEWPALGEEEPLDFGEEHPFTREYLQAQRDLDIPEIVIPLPPPPASNTHTSTTSASSNNRSTAATTSLHTPSLHTSSANTHSTSARMSPTPPITILQNPAASPKKPALSSTSLAVPSSPIPTPQSSTQTSFTLSPNRPIKLLEKPRVVEKSIFTPTQQPQSVSQTLSSSFHSPLPTSSHAIQHQLSTSNGHLPVKNAIENPSPRRLNVASHLPIELSPQKPVGPPSQHASPMRKLAFDSQPHASPIKTLFDPSQPHSSPLRTSLPVFDAQRNESTPRKLQTAFEPSKVQQNQGQVFEPKVLLKNQISTFEPTLKTLPSNNFDSNFLPDSTSNSRRSSLGWSDHSQSQSQSQNDEENSNHSTGRFLDKKIVKSPAKSQKAEGHERASFNFYNPNPPASFAYTPNFGLVDPRVRNALPQQVMQQAPPHSLVPPHMHPHPLHHPLHPQQQLHQRQSIPAHLPPPVFWSPEPEAVWQPADFVPSPWEAPSGWEDSSAQHFQPPMHPHFRPPQPQPQIPSHMQHPVQPQIYRHQHDGAFDLSNNPYLQPALQLSNVISLNDPMNRSPYAYPNQTVVMHSKNFSSQISSHVPYSSSQNSFRAPHSRSSSTDSHTGFVSHASNSTFVSSTSSQYNGRSSSQTSLSATAAVATRSSSPPTPVPPVVPIVVPRKLPSIPTLGSLPGAYGSTFNSSIWGQNQTSVLNKDGWDFSTTDSAQSTTSKLIDSKDSPVW